MLTHDIDFVESFTRREPALKALRIPYKLSADGEKITFDRKLTDFSKHQRDVVEFVLNPLTRLELFDGLDTAAQRAIAEAIKQTYIDGDGKW